MAGELGHVHIPMDGLLESGQPVPSCNCGFTGDAESLASLTGIERNLLPFWLSRFPDHPLAGLDPHEAARAVRTYGEDGDPLARAIFRQQAAAVGLLFTVVSNLLDPDVYFVGGGVVEAREEFRDWFLGEVRGHMHLREEQASVAVLRLVPDLDTAGARGSALAAADLATSLRS
jgi:predicted NBD/HSP70 family sugar kinase